MCDYSFVAILPKNWRRYTVPQGLTVIQWIADFSDRIQQLQQISHVSHSGSTKGLKVIFSLISLSHAMRPGLQIRHFWVAKSLFLTITFHQKKQDKTFCF